MAICWICKKRLPKRQSPNHKKLKFFIHKDDNKIRGKVHQTCIEFYEIRRRIQVAAGLIKEKPSITFDMAKKVSTYGKFGKPANIIIMDDVNTGDIVYTPQLKETMEKWYNETLASRLTGGTNTWQEQQGDPMADIQKVKELMSQLVR